LKKLLVLIAFSVLLLVPLGTQNAFAAVFIDSFDVSGQETIPFGVAFSANGLKMFVVGLIGVDVNEYACTSAFDVSTCGFTDSFPVSGQETFPTGVAFSANGLKMFVVGANGDAVNEYACTGAFDVSTCGFTDSFDVSGQETEPNGVAFSADGLTMFVVGLFGDNVYEYACGTAFDVSTCAFTDSFDVSGQETDPLGVAFSANGLRMFVVGAIGDDVNEYACGTAFDVSTCAFTDSFSVATQETLPTGVAFSADGLTMFVVGVIGDDVNEYALGTAFDVSSVPPPDMMVAGTPIPIDTTMVLALGAQYTAAWMIPAIIAAIGIGIVIARKF